MYVCFKLNTHDQYSYAYTSTYTRTYTYTYTHIRVVRITYARVFSLISLTQARAHTYIRMTEDIVCPWYDVRYN